VTNQEFTKTRPPAADPISENAARGAFGRRRRRIPPTASREPVTAPPANPPTAGEDTSTRSAGPRPLRRWSVAELIARALAAPPPTA
jgi:hypothetical protein